VYLAVVIEMPLFEIMRTGKYHQYKTDVSDLHARYFKFMHLQ